MRSDSHERRLSHSPVVAVTLRAVATARKGGGRRITIEPTHTTWATKTGTFPRKAVTAGIDQVKKRYRQLKHRYGPKYTEVMVLTAFMNDPIMPSNCDIILQQSATPDQLAALGTALWHWCSRTAGDSGVYQYLDNQGLADMIAGKFPALSHDARGRPHFRAWDRESPDRQAAIDKLRREIPSAGVDDVVVDEGDATHHGPRYGHAMASKGCPCVARACLRGTTG
jgi:hypothetical protein